jgi:hypothetical protein
VSLADVECGDLDTAFFPASHRAGQRPIGWSPGGLRSLTLPARQSQSAAGLPHSRDGVLKLDRPLPLAERENARDTVKRATPGGQESVED